VRETRFTALSSASLPRLLAGTLELVRPDRDAILKALEQVIDPELKRPVTDLDMVRDVLVEDDGAVSVTIALTVAGCPLRSSFQEQVTKFVGAVEGVTAVELGFDVMSPEEKAALVTRLRGGRPERTISLSPTTRVVVVASGKGGVGKSTLTANLAYALSTLGEQVGVLDGDVYGHSIPHMLGIQQKPIAVDEMIVPPVRGDLKLMSIGFFLDDNAPIMWRGPMLHKALEQFLSDVHWGDLDTLVVDMPPGTGDVPMSLGQLLPRAEVLVVTTPQPAAQKVAVRAAQMAVKTGMRILGAVENMSYLAGSGQELFGSGGGQALADEIGVPLLARIPLDPVMREAADDGNSVLEVAPESEAAEAIVALAESLTASRAGTIRKALTVLG
jgi:ATP-binding protein involved in chromosome partitioning